MWAGLKPAPTGSGEGVSILRRRTVARFARGRFIVGTVRAEPVRIRAVRIRVVRAQTVRMQMAGVGAGFKPARPRTVHSNRYVNADAAAWSSIHSGPPWGWMSLAG
jgi:hypothetical protein